MQISAPVQHLVHAEARDLVHVVAGDAGAAAGGGDEGEVRRVRGELQRARRERVQLWVEHAGEEGGGLLARRAVRRAVRAVRAVRRDVEKIQQFMSCVQLQDGEA